MKFTLLILTVSFLFSSFIEAKECPLNQSVYEDIDGNGFLLEFSNPIADSGQILSTVEIKHNKRGVIFMFNSLIANGTGQALLIKPDNKSGTEHPIHFFKKNLKTGDSDKAEPYIFIEGLSSADWYGEQAEIARETPIGNPIWKFVHCMKNRSSVTNVSKAQNTGVSNAETIAKNGSIEAYGVIKEVNNRGARTLGIDYINFISKAECLKLIGTRKLNWSKDECDRDALYLNENKLLRYFKVSDQVEITIHHPDQQPTSYEAILSKSWDNLVSLWTQIDKLKNLEEENLKKNDHPPRTYSEGLWKITRRNDVIERLEWVYMP